MPVGAEAVEPAEELAVATRSVACGVNDSGAFAGALAALGAGAAARGAGAAEVAAGGETLPCESGRMVTVRTLCGSV